MDYDVSNTSIGFVANTSLAPMFPFRACVASFGIGNTEPWSCNTNISGNSGALTQSFVGVADGSTSTALTEIHASNNELVSFQPGSIVQVTLSEEVVTGSFLLLTQGGQGTVSNTVGNQETNNPAFKFVALEPGGENEIIWAACIGSFQERTAEF